MLAKPDSMKLNSMTLSKGILILLLLMPFSVTQAGIAKDKLFAFYKNVNSMRAAFQQSTIDTRFNATQASSGTLVMQRPGKFRWDYTSPYEQIIVADGKKIWVYDKDLEQITVKPLDAILGNTPALLLSGNPSLEQNFNIVELKTNSDGLHWVELFPKETDTSFTSVRLAFGTTSLVTMELIDSFGQTTRLKFSDMQNNPDIDTNVFNFVPPKGVDVIGEE